MIVYKTTNLLNGKIYIGQDSHNNPKYLGSGKLLRVSINKNGLNNFKKEILEYCNSKEQLNEREIYWINKLNSLTPNGYNITPGGGGGDTITHHPNKKKIIETVRRKNKGKKRSCESKLRYSKGTKERYKDLAEREKTRVALKKFYENPKERLRVSKSSKNFYSKKENRINCSIKKLGKNNPRWGGYVYVYNSKGNLHRIYESVGIASRKLKISPSAIRNNSKTKRFKGYSFKIYKYLK